MAAARDKMTPAEVRLYDRLNQIGNTMEEELEGSVGNTMEKIHHLKNLKATPL